MNQVFLSDSAYVYFGTSSATTGAATNADSTPTVVVAEDGTDLGYAPTVTNVATGLYKAEIAATSGNGFEAGRRYNVYAVATVGGVTGRDGVGEFEVLAVDLNTGVASVTGAVGSVTGLTAANLDVAVSTRMATYTQPTGFLSATFPATVASTTNITAGTITTATNVTTVNGLAADVITAASIAADAGTELGTAVWATVARTLTAATNITSTGGTTVPQTGDSFARIGVNGAGLTAIDLPDQTMNITGNITGNLSGSVGSVTGLTASNLDVAVSTRLATASYTAPLDAAATRTAIGLASANLDTQLDALPTAAEIVAAQLTTAITEAYRANGAAPTLAEFMSEVLAHLGESSIVATTKTIKKFDRTTVAETYTLNSATAPTSITRDT